MRLVFQAACPLLAEYYLLRREIQALMEELAAVLRTRKLLLFFLQELEGMAAAKVEEEAEEAPS